MCEHRCYIGLYNNYEDSDLVTLEDLIKIVQQDQESYEYRVANDYRVGRPPLTLAEYLDTRKNTSLYRFNYCPRCGKIIDWAKLRQENVK